IYTEFLTLPSFIQREPPLARQCVPLARRYGLVAQQPRSLAQQGCPLARWSLHQFTCHPCSFILLSLHKESDSIVAESDPIFNPAIPSCELVNLKHHTMLHMLLQK